MLSKHVRRVILLLSMVFPVYMFTVRDELPMIHVTASKSAVTWVLLVTVISFVGSQVAFGNITCDLFVDDSEQTPWPSYTVIEREAEKRAEKFARVDKALKDVSRKDNREIMLTTIADRDELLRFVRRIVSNDCGCTPVCRCDSPEANRIFKECVREEADLLLRRIAERAK